MPKKVEKKKAKITSPKKRAKINGLSLSVYDAKGKSQGRVNLPKEIFDVKAPSSLLAQAVRVYLINQRKGTSSTKTRAEVAGGGRKPWRQKGTGRARVGSIRVPHWRGGGIVFGPKPRDFELRLPNKMRRRALFSALSDKFLNRKVVCVSSFKNDGKTKKMKMFLEKLPIENFEKQDLLLVLAEVDEKTIRSARNLEHVEVSQAKDLNTYQVLKNDWLIIEKDALKKLSETFLREPSAQRASRPGGRS